MKNLNSISLKLSESGELLILDQQMLPDQENWILVRDPDHMIEIIQQLKVRGAPLIGVAAALSLALWSQKNQPQLGQFLQVSMSLRQSRPTAVNLMNALDRLNQVAEATKVSTDSILNCALEIYQEDVDLCLQMAQVGSELIQDGDSLLTHCNTGGLATVGVGTALGVITQAHSQGKKIHVYVDETRPLLQGGRLTTWELKKAGVPYTLICDNMAASLMAQNRVNRVFLGADRIALNGDFANKIGTYNLAVLCHHHKIPFYTVAPSTTIDFNCPDGASIPVEQRQADEVRGVAGSFGQVRWSPVDSQVHNPAFDVTPAHLLSGLVIDNKIITPKQIQEHGNLKQALL
jgi:methylthioribose-1-phosphate isomerase